METLKSKQAKSDFIDRLIQVCVQPTQGCTDTQIDAPLPHKQPGGATFCRIQVMQQCANSSSTQRSTLPLFRVHE